MMSLKLSILGVGLWGSGLPGWSVSRPVLAGAAGLGKDPPSKPAPIVLAATERRRAPDTVLLALQAAEEACRVAGVDPKSLPSIFASIYGDIAITDYLCSTLASAPYQVSPTKFHNSVHNAASGYWTMGVGCVEPSIALSAQQASFSMALLETAIQVQCEQRPCLLVVYDGATHGPLTEIAPSHGLFAGALVLAPHRAGLGAALGLTLESGVASNCDPINPALVELYVGNPMARCLRVFEALARATSQIVSLPAGPNLVLRMEISPWPN